jgi:hypothetical protein
VQCSWCTLDSHSLLCCCLDLESTPAASQASRLVAGFSRGLAEALQVMIVCLRCFAHINCSMGRMFTGLGCAGRGLLAGRDFFYISIDTIACLSSGCAASQDTTLFATVPSSGTYTLLTGLRCNCVVEPLCLDCCLQ